MGVESDQMVFDYLSRIGDLAQTALPASQRMQLVAQLRKDIDRERRESDNPATVRRILGRIGSPDAVVEAAAGTVPGRFVDPGPADSAPAGGPYGPYGVPPTRRSGERGGGKAGDRGSDRGGDRRGDGSAGRGTDKGGAAAAGRGGRGKGAAEDRWLTGERRDGRPRPGDELTGLPGMTGGVFIPFDDEDLAEDDADDEKRPGPASRLTKARARARTAAEAEEEEEEVEEEQEARTPRRWLPRRRGPRTVTWGSPLLLLAAALLVAGAVIGSWIPLGLGWLAGYLSRQLTRNQAKFGILGIPGAAAAGLVVWVWGRDAGKWGDPIAQGQMGQAFQDAYPVAVRIAAVGSALYLLWRSRRRI